MDKLSHTSKQELENVSGGSDNESNGKICYVICNACHELICPKAPVPRKTYIKIAHARDWKCIKCGSTDKSYVEEPC